MLPFTCEDRAVEYSTIGGPLFYNEDVVVYANTPNNLAVALNRLDVNREGEGELSRNNLKVAPGSNRGLSRYLNSYYSRVRESLSPLLGQLGSQLDEQIKSALNKAHIKYFLRRRCIKKLLECEDMISGLFMERVTIKVKIPEAAKNGKGTRAIGDFTCPGSLIAPFLIDPLKSAFAEPVEHDNCVIRYVGTTNAHEIDKIVTEMWNSEVNYFIYFSDDMMCKIIRDGVPEYFNLDISSCDKSNTTAVFHRLRWFYAHSDWDELIARAVKQCTQPIIMQNPHKNGEYITAQTVNPTEFSGTILTTVLNNIASSGICCSINYHLRRGGSESTEAIISKAAFAVGYSVTAERCQNPEDLQFLKMSFWEGKNGELHSFLNLGAMLRSFGTTWGDYPYNKRTECLEDSIRFRNWSVLQGYKHAGESELMRALSSSKGCQRPKKISKRTVGIHTRQLERENHYKLWNDSVAREPVPRSAVLRRYRLSEPEYEELLKATRESDIGHVLRYSGIDKILNRDYGYACKAG